MNYKKGFTLIELLVVIAIIGILSSVVLASLNSARDKGVDAKIKSEIGQMRAGMEVIYDNNAGKYTSAAVSSIAPCAVISAPWSENPIKKSLESVLNTVGSAGTDSKCTASTTGYTISAKLKGTGYYCVDSIGNSTTTAALATSNAYCK